MSPDDVDRLVKQRLEQAFHGVFRKLIDTSERAAQAAEASASSNKLDGLTKSLKVEQWKPTNREEELKTWKEWSFQFTNWLVANDPEYEADFAGLEEEKEVDHAVIPDAQEGRSQRLFGVLCSVLKGRPLLLVRQMAKNGLEAWRLLKKEMESKEKARSLALVRQLAAWRFDEHQDLHSQLVRYEEALRTYESSSGKAFPEELVLATVVTGLREPLKSQVQLQMQTTTKYADVREWILRAMTTASTGHSPWRIKGKSGKYGSKGKDGKGKNGKGKDSKGKDGKGKKGKPGDGKGWQQGGKQWSGWQSAQDGAGGWNSQGWSNQGSQPGGGKGKSVPSAGRKGIGKMSARRKAKGAEPFSNHVLQCVYGCLLGPLFGVSSESLGGARSLQGRDLQLRNAKELQAHGGFRHDSRACDGRRRTEVVIGSGADISVAPLKMAMLGKPAKRSGILMQDAQGKRIPEKESRVLDIEVETTEGTPILLKEKFCVAPVSSIIVSMGRLLRWGWSLGTCGGKPVIESGGHKVPIRLRRNTLTVLATVASIAAAGCSEAAAPATQPQQVNMMTFDDLGRLPPEAEALAGRPGWSILRSGLPFPVAHNVEEINVEQSLWSSLCASRFFESLILTLSRRDIAMASPPVPMVDGPAGVGDLPDEMAAEERPQEPEGEGDKEEELEGVTLSVATPLKDLKELCRKLGLSVSGGKHKVLRRLRVHYENLEKQVASEVARKMFAEQEREPGLLKTPVLPSSRQQELHNVTHHPFQPWCEACLLGRSRQNPHRNQGEEPKGDELPDNKQSDPVIQIDYECTFTKLRGELADDEDRPGDDQGQPDNQVGQADGQEGEQGEGQQDGAVDVRDQYGLCLLGAESTTGWLSMQVSPGGTIVFQSDTEPSAKQVVNAVCACRAKLGLKTETRWIVKASHGSNGRVGKGLDTIRRNALTLKAFVGDRVQGRIEGHYQYHVYSWFLRPAAFLRNRFTVGSRRSTPYEILHGGSTKELWFPSVSR
ncbi:GIP [Symbiodinium sp. CCMP2592]|nr:GIP [Symbiodinium sp. CCMP2592]